MTTPAPPTPHPRHWRRRRILLLLGFLALVAAVPFGYPLYQHWQIDRDLAAVLAETDRLDPGWRLEDMRAKLPDVPEQENAAPLLAKLGRAFSKGWYSPTYKKVPVPSGLRPGYLNHWITDITWSMDKLPEVNLLNEQQILALESERTEHREAFEVALKLKGLRQCRIPYDSTKERDDIDSGLRTAWKFLEFETLRLCQDKDLDAALDCQMTHLDLAGILRRELDYINQLKRGACLDVTCTLMKRILAQGVPNAQRLREVQLAYERERFDDWLVHCLRCDRAEQWSLHERVMREPLEKQREYMELIQSLKKEMGDARAEPPWYLRWLPKPGPGDPRMLIMDDIKFMNLAVEFAKKPAIEQVAGLESFLDAHQQSTTKSISLGKWAPMTWRDAMNQATTRTAIALERYRQAKGDWPATLDQLVPGFLAEAPLDIYSAKPLRYRKAEHGVLVYSVGQDHVDNAGKLRFDPEEQPQSSFKGLDIGVRLWDPAHRRQAALKPVMLESEIP